MINIPYPYVFVTSFLILAGFFFSLPIFKFLDDPIINKETRNISLDGIRYFLASFVFFSHSLYLHDIVVKNTWSGNNSPEISYLAEIGVTTFFMISAYLFWSIVKKSKYNINWFNLYAGRFFRIAPLVFFSTICISVVVISITRELPKKSLMDWFNIFLNTKPDFTSFTNTWSLTAGVCWTLVYEWGFYFSLPFLSFFLRKPIELTISLLFIILYAGSFLWKDLPLNYIAMFVFGMLVSDLSDRIFLSTKTAEMILIITVSMIFIIRPAPFIYSNCMNFLLALSLLCLVNGATLFGLLNFKGFKRLGDASYSIYMMHALVIFICYKIAFDFNLLSENFLIISCAAYFLVLIISLFTHKYIEKFFIKIGNDLISLNNYRLKPVG